MNKLTYWRAKRKLTVRDLAEMADVSPNTISKIEKGHRKGTAVTLGKLAEALQVDVSEFAELLDPKECRPVATNLWAATTATAI